MLDGPLAAHMPNSNWAATVSKDLGNKDEIELGVHHSRGDSAGAAAECRHFVMNESTGALVFVVCAGDPHLLHS